MDKIILFLKPTIKKALIGLLVWAGLSLITYFGFTACLFGDCKRDGHFVSCSPDIVTLIGYVLYYGGKYFFPVIAYLASCYVNSSHCCKKNET